jgi:hypothetical protein
MHVRNRHPFAGPLAAALALAAVSALSSGLISCSHRSYRDAASSQEESVVGRVLGTRWWQGSLPGAVGTAGRTLYPLAVGNRWDYDLHLRVTMVTGGVPQPPEIIDSSVRDEITGTQQIGDRTYYLQQETNPVIVGPGRLLPNYVIPLRQDLSGLYEREIVTFFPAAGTEAMRAYVARAVARPAERPAFERAYVKLMAQLAAARRDAATFALPHSGGPDLSELALLRYPLFPGARWAVRESPNFGRAVVRRERIVVPAGAFAAWQVRGESELYGPRDRVVFWYASVGLVRMSFHYESEATDEAGNVVGHVVGDQDQLLSAFNLVAPNTPNASAEAPAEGAEPR